MATGTSGGSIVNMTPQTTPEERQLKNERMRIEAMIRSYNRDPKSYNAQMTASLERMAQQYGIMFNKVNRDNSAGILRKAGAFLGGVVDAVALDFIPDDWYSSEETRSAKNWGKGVGTVGSIALTMGGAAAARGVVAGGKAAAGAMSAKQAARLAARTSVKKGKPAKPFTNKYGNQKNPPGNSQQRRQERKKWEKDPKNQATPDREYTKLSDKPSKVGQKFDQMDADQIKNMASNIAPGFEQAGIAAGYTGPGALANFVKTKVSGALSTIGQTKGWKWAQNKVTDDVVNAVKNNPGGISDVIAGNKLTSGQIKEVVKQIKKTHGNKKVGKTLIAEVKGAGSTFSANTDEILGFVNKIGGKKKVTVENIKKIGKDAKLNSSQVKEITEALVNGNIKTMDDAAKFLIQSTKTPSADYLALLRNPDLWMGAGAGVAATSPVTGLNPFGEGLTPSKEEQMEEMYDPLNAQQ